MKNVALVGAGNIGKTHASCYRSLDEVKLAAIVDTDPAAASELAGADAQAFATLDAALKAVDISIVDICAPTPVHTDYAVQALEAGKHVLLEKPMARTLEQCDAIIASAKKAETTIMVAHVLRFFPEYAQAKQVIDSGAIGTPAVVRTSRGGGFPRFTDSWYTDFRQSGGCVMDLTVHDFDWLLWCLGPAERVFAKGLAKADHGTKDYALITIRFKNGAIAHVESTWMRPTGFETKFEVAGDGGLIDFRSKDASSLRFALTEGDGNRAAVEMPESPLAENPYMVQIKHFLECVETGASPMISLQDGRAALEIALAALESIKTGRPVHLS